MQEEIESPFRRKRALGSVKIDLHASAVKEEADEEEIHDQINKFSELEVVF